ncbi:hypothetical protein D3C85_1604680 [compost metagenome]
MNANTTRFVASAFKHTFCENDVLMQVIGPCNVTQYLVDQVISDTKIRVLLCLKDGSFSETPRYFEGNELKFLIKNELATKLLSLHYQDGKVSA